LPRAGTSSRAFVYCKLTVLRLQDVIKNAENTVAIRVVVIKPDLIRIGGQIEDGELIILIKPFQDTIKYMPAGQWTHPGTKKYVNGEAKGELLGST